jgi:hypothetical protein
MSIWRIIAVINLPRVIKSDVPIGPGDPLPPELKIVSSLSHELTKNIKGIDVKLAPWQDQSIPGEFFGPSFSPAKLSFSVEADTPENALIQSDDLLELILDDISFQLQYAIRVFGLDVIDVTPPVTAGMQRQVISFPIPYGYQSPKFRQSAPLGNVQASTTPTLELRYQTDDEQVRAALRWYVKALAAPFEADRFVFYWIALEIMCTQSDVSVEKPYIARCGHEIPQCPVCGTSTVKEVNGPTIKKFLEEETGIDPKIAKELWEMRQMFHGANQLTTKATEKLTRLTMLLRFAVAQSLKKSFKLPQNELPTIKMDAPVMGLDIALNGTREITETDL